MPDDILAALRTKALLFDGAMGTVLQAQGLEPGTPVACRVLERPDEVRAVHAGYAEAGADILTAATFDAGRPRLESVGLGDRLADVHAGAVALARAAAGASRWVAGNVSPSVARAPRGPVDAAAARAEFGEQVRVQADAGVDLLLIETMYDLGEARLALESALGTGLPTFVSMTFGMPGDAGSVLSFAGDHPAEAARVLSADGAHVVGANCTLGPGAMDAVVNELLAGATVPVLVQPNAGQPVPDADGRPTWAGRPDEFAAAAVRWVRQGVAAVGGCCGTTPAHIEAMRRALDAG